MTPDGADREALTVHASAPLAPLPVFSGQQMAQAMTVYRQLQQALDQSIMTIGERRSRKKGYWRALAVAFNLTVEPVEERWEVSGTFEDGRENFGWLVTYRAVAPNGRAQAGDGACFAVEKAGRFKCPHPEPGRSLHFPHTACPDFDSTYTWRTLSSEATEHNVRAHAHTRGYNRAVSNLVGFGEVSAEEPDTADYSPPPSLAGAESPAPPPTRPAPVVSRPSSLGSAGDEAPITEAQDKRFYAIAKANGWGDGPTTRTLSPCAGIGATRSPAEARFNSGSPRSTGLRSTIGGISSDQESGAEPETEAFELYPAESRLLDPSNYSTIWCFPVRRLKVGVDVRDVRDADLALVPQPRTDIQEVTRC